MKTHSVVDNITNSSSTVYISPPKNDKLLEVAKLLGYKSIRVNLSKEKFMNGDMEGIWEFLDFYHLDINDYVGEKREELYKMVNTAYLDRTFRFYKEGGMDDETDYPFSAPEIECVLIDKDGNELEIKEMLKLLITCFDRE